MADAVETDDGVALFKVTHARLGLVSQSWPIAVNLPLC